MFSCCTFFRRVAHATSVALLVLCSAFAFAAPLDEIGVTALRALDPTLTGQGVSVAQPEATSFTNIDPLPGIDNDDFEVNPSAVGQPESLFTYTNSKGLTATTFPNAIGSESGHADMVGANFYGASSGVAPGVSHVDNYNANYFYNTIIRGGTATPAKVINQSFIFGSEVPAVDRNYDNYIANHNVIIVTGAGNGRGVSSPGTSYNGIDVAAFGGASSIGPALDGRSKPDLTAPAGFTSFSTPLVSGSAAILVQAGNLNRGGAGTSSLATDARTVKALLLNGAVKPPDWMHTPTAPLDPRYGAGVLNVYNSYQDLAAGRQVIGNVPTLRGWDFATVGPAAGNPNGAVTNHYYFTLAAGTPYQVTSTLVWNRRAGETTINNLDLVLLDRSTNTVVAGSFSTIDNVEHLFASLAAGEYDLQVRKNASGITPTEQYAIAFNFASVPEPSTAVLLTVGAAGFLARRRRG